MRNLNPSKRLGTCVTITCSVCLLPGVLGRDKNLGSNQRWLFCN